MQSRRHLVHRRSVGALTLLAVVAAVHPAAAKEPTRLQLGTADYVDYGLILGGLALLGGGR